MKNNQVHAAYCKALIKTGAIEVRGINEPPFSLRSGKKSYIYVNHAKIASSANAYKAFIDGISSLLQEVYKDKEFILCNVDSKISAQMTGALAYILEKPQIIFKSKQLTFAEKGSGEQITGNLQWNLPVAIVDDVMTGRDGTANNVAILIQQQFPYIQDIQIFTGLIRNKQLQKSNQNSFPTHAVLSFDDVITEVWNTLSLDQQKAIEKERTL